MTIGERKSSDIKRDLHATATSLEKDGGFVRTVMLLREAAGRLAVLRDIETNNADLRSRVKELEAALTRAEAFIRKGSNPIAHAFADYLSALHDKGSE